ncbi:Histone deacetylase complex subunit SAP18 [Venturia nashicola]|uniref:Histone deacetylase complex subunit SAP18 n=1 Tax=Venturia nashicola TaxID=86259 RepID=A0A4Z1NWL9_9PEZI|nr:Histone deacetylase complex subunit SAP18 [Venturia nashicola]TLD27566.1 Histone deacetylase complex subunit SAP18 [Venturia nashicola]
MASKLVDRQADTPFLLRLFYKTGSHHTVQDFQSDSQPPHVQIYTWTNATLTELSQLIANNLPQLLPTPSVGTRLSFELVVQEPTPQTRYTMKRLGTVVLGATTPSTNGITNGDEDDAGLGDEAITSDENKTLADARLVVGDYLDCAILPPLENGDIAPVPRIQATPPTTFSGRSNGGDYGGRRGRGGFGDAGRLGGAFGGDRGGVPNGEWRRGDVPPGGFDRGGRGRGGRGGRGW